MSKYCLIFGTISGLCLDHVWPNSTSSLARVLQHARLSQHGLRPMYMDCLLVGPCWDHIWLYFQIRYSSEIFKNRLTWSEAYAYRVTTFWDHAQTMLGPCLVQLYLRLARYLKILRLAQLGLQDKSTGNDRDTVRRLCLHDICINFYLHQKRKISPFKMRHFLYFEWSKKI